MLYNGTVGYNWMTVPFTICGVLTFIYAVTAAYFAATHNLVRHRAWAIRAFFIGNASPLYRLLYQVTFHGPLDNLSIGSSSSYRWDWLSSIFFSSSDSDFIILGMLKVFNRLFVIISASLEITVGLHHEVLVGVARARSFKKEALF